MVIVAVEEGKLRGKTGTDIGGNVFYSFQNIPYAAPPVGELRFRAPRPPQPWQGIRDATKQGSGSLSRDTFSRSLILGSEDCLILNIYTPELPQGAQSKAQKPVMFFIHGGIFSMGSSSTDIYGPEFLVAEDIVLVTINYRLGILGFLSLDDSSLGVPGNAAFKDMVMALKWVQRNIANFGGDPNNVTIFGESSGGVSTHLLMLSPMAKGLFHKVMAQSGSALCPWAIGRRSASLVSKRMGFYSNNDRKLLEFLEGADDRAILKAQLQLDEEDLAEYHIRHFGLVLERPGSTEEPFLTKHPLDIILSGDYSHVPLLMGYNSCEGMFFGAFLRSQKRSYFRDLNTAIPLDLRIQRGCHLSEAIAEKIKMSYFGCTDPNPKDHLAQFFELFTDTSFFRAIYSAVRHQTWTAAHPIYLYRMTIDTEMNYYKRMDKYTHIPGASHGDDLGYLFKSKYTPDQIAPGSPEDVGQRRFTKMWTNFARFGNPTPDKSDPLLNTTWKPVEPMDVHFLDIGQELKMYKNPEPKRMAFWDEIYRINPNASKL